MGRKIKVFRHHTFADITTLNYVVQTRDRVLVVDTIEDVINCILNIRKQEEICFPKGSVILLAPKNNRSILCKEVSSDEIMQIARIICYRY